MKKTIVYMLLALLAAFPDHLSAQQFKVKKFRELSNDISAFVEPVKDLNGTPCALLKVICSPDFAFSTPLGIVKRVNEVGEIWLYLPAGSRMITLKHPRWGVVRDYGFPQELESRMTYEMSLEQPRMLAAPEIVFQPQKKTIILNDTIIGRHAVPPKKRREKIRWCAAASIGFSAYGPSYGIRLSGNRKHGIYISALSNFGKAAHVGTCDRNGNPVDGSEPDYDTGKTRSSRLLITAGWLQPLVAGKLFLHAGAGYSRYLVLWEKAGGNWWKNQDLSNSGFAADAGLAYRLRHLHLGIGVVTFAGRHWEPQISIGYEF